MARAMKSERTVGRFMDFSETKITRDFPRQDTLTLALGMGEISHEPVMLPVKRVGATG